MAMALLYTQAQAQAQSKSKSKREDVVCRGKGDRWQGKTDTVPQRASACNENAEARDVCRLRM